MKSRESIYNFVVTLSGLSLALMLSSTANAQYNEGSTNYSIGGNFSTYGIGIHFTGKSDYHLIGNDRIQVRGIIGGVSADDSDDLDDDIDIAGIDYENQEFDSFGGQVGFDWYPFSSSFFASRVFFSAGTSYLDRDIDLISQRDRDFAIGNFAVTRNQDIRVNADIEQSTFGSYFSVGWGNRISGDKGFSFLAELGELLPFEDAKVDLSLSGQDSSLISADDLERERKQIEDDIDGAQLLATIGFGYRF